MAGDNLNHVEENAGQRKVTSIAQAKNGQIDLTISTSSQGSNAVKSFRVGVTSDGHVYGTDVVNILHPERNRVSPDGFISMGWSDTKGFLGDAVKPELAAEIREAYQAFKKDGVLDAKEAGKVHEIIDKALQQLPLQRIDTSGIIRE